MAKRIIMIVVLISVLTACIRRHNADNLHYFQDLESINGWFAVEALRSDIKGHSGNYSILTNAQYNYSIGFGKRIGEISKYPLKKIRATVWCNSPSKLATGAFCVQITNPANEDKLWDARVFEDFIKVENKWTKAVIDIAIPKEAQAADNMVKVFLWNKGSVPVYADDFEIEFTE